MFRILRNIVRQNLLLLAQRLWRWELIEFRSGRHHQWGSTPDSLSRRVRRLWPTPVVPAIRHKLLLRFPRTLPRARMMIRNLGMGWLRRSPRQGQRDDNDRGYRGNRTPAPPPAIRNLRPLSSQVSQDSFFQSRPRLDRRILRERRVEFATEFLIRGVVFVIPAYVYSFVIPVSHLAHLLPANSSCQLLFQNLSCPKDSRAHCGFVDPQRRRNLSGRHLFDHRQNQRIAQLRGQRRDQSF